MPLVQAIEKSGSELKYEFIGNRQHLIHILRFMMFPDGHGVLDRKWEFRSLYGGITYPYPIVKGAANDIIFPESEVDLVPIRPFRVDGMRLVERSALVAEFEETELVRLCEGASEGIDLWFWIDTGNYIDVKTDDEELYLRLREHFERTAGEEHNGCFW